MRALIVFGGVTLIALFAIAVIAGGAHWLDRRELKARQNSREVRRYRQLLAQIESECASNLLVDQYDLTAHRVKDLINTARLQRRQ